MAGVPKPNEFQQESFKKLKVSEKFKKVFGRLRLNLIVIFAVILIIDLVAVLSLRNIYKVYYEQNSQQGEIRITIQALAKYYLWALAAEEEDDRNEQMAGAAEKIQELNDGLGTLSKVYKDDLTTVYNHIKFN